MSGELATHVPHQHVSHQFEDIDQQNDAYVVGMWAFLVTEVMFFGGLFTAYAVFRYKYPEVFNSASHELNTLLGLGNTMVLLTSSLFMALSVRCAMLGKKKGQIGWMLLVIVCALTFLGIKTIEYATKYHHHLVPGTNFQWETYPGDPAIDPGKAQLFFGLYFAMTGLHGIHVIIGILIISTVAFLRWRDHPAVEDYMTTELTGLYWHFVDIVWIFLYPLLYLINPIWGG